MNIKIVKKTFTKSNHILVLNRSKSELEVYSRVPNERIREEYKLRDDFDLSEYCCYERKYGMKCLFGREDSPTPEGCFEITQKSRINQEYVSGYYPNRGKVKFFGYLVIFEDYFIHSDLYEEEVTSDTIMQNVPISKDDTKTSGCIRVSQNELEWLIENIEVGTPVIM